jgi:Ni/Co efflux regulator RcnB
MKKLSILLAAVSFSLTAMAQNSTSGNTMEKDKKIENENKMTKEQKHCYEMKNGKMMEMKEGKSMTMTTDAKLDNGTVIMKDGTVKMSDGTTKKIKEGECVNMDGKIEKKKMEKKEDTKMEKKEDNMNK